MGLDPGTSVVNRFGQSWDCHNLFLCGANLFANGIGLRKPDETTTN